MEKERKNKRKKNHKEVREMNVGNTALSLRIQNKLQAMNGEVVKNTEKLASGLRINRAGDDAAGIKISEKMRSQIRGLDMSIDNGTDGISMLQTAEGGLETITDLLHRMNELTIKAVNGTYTESDLNKISIEYEQCKREIDRIAETTTFNGKHLLNINTGETKLTKGTSRTGTATMVANARDKLDFSTIGDGNEFIVKIDDEEHRFTFCYGEKNVSDGSTRVGITGNETNEEKAEKLAEAIENKIGTVGVDVHASYPDDGKQYTIAIFALTEVEGQTISMDMKTNAPVIKLGNNHEDVLYVNLKSVTADSLGIKETNVNTIKEANEATKKISEALDTINAHRANLGAAQNRIEYAIDRITIERENTTAAESRIRDVNMAEEMVKYTKNQIIQQTAQSMLSQANQENGRVLGILAER